MGFLVGCDAWVNLSPPVVLPSCSCACEARETEESNPACRSSCEAAWLKCDTPATAIPDDIEAQVALFRSYLARKNVPDSMVEPMVSAFRTAPEYQRRGMLEQYE